MLRRQADSRLLYGEAQEQDEGKRQSLLDRCLCHAPILKHAFIKDRKLRLGWVQ